MYFNGHNGADKMLSVASVPEAQRMEQDIKDWAQYSQWIAAAMSKRMSELGLTQKMLAGNSSTYPRC